MKKLLFPVLLLSSLLAACAAPQTQRLRAASALPGAAVVELGQVPFIPDTGHQYGPATLATMLAHAGREVAPQMLAEQVYRPDRHGSLVAELAAAGRREGRLVYPVAPRLEALLAALQQGQPVLVLQNNGFRFLPIWQYAVVVGADRPREMFILRSGPDARLEVPFASFERRWARADYWGALVLDPATLPATLDSRTAVRELALMQQAGAVADARAGFSRAVQNWPDEKPAWLGLAGTSLRLGKTEEAEAALRELLRRAPQYGPGLNNLADLLLRTGRPLEALPLAERAVALLDIPATRATLQAAQEAMAPIEAEALPPLPGQQDEPVLHKPVTKAKKKSAHRKHRHVARKASGKKAKARAAKAGKATPVKEASREPVPAP